jgi:hypothetical protein
MCHDGGFNSSCWISGTKTLLLAGQDAPGRDRRGLPPTGDTYLRIILAVHPARGTIDDQWLNWSSDSASPTYVRWYKAVVSPDPNFTIVSIDVGPPFPGEDVTRFARTTIIYAESPYRSVSLLIDGSGQEQLDRRVFNDTPNGMGLPSVFESAALLVPIDPVAVDAFSGTQAR